MDKTYMQQALALAEKGRGQVDPNPMVGAVLVKDGQVIGEGYHAIYGEAHAEVCAFENAKSSVKDATLYVTLEPCAHYGKTPPCAAMIIDKQVGRVVVGSLDPNPLVSGRGIEMLKQAGIAVDVGVLDDENRRLNRAFFKHITTGLPYVMMKTAMTADGKIATRTRHSRWISGDASRERVHQLRHAMMGIMVGVGTIIHDNPSLTARNLKHEARQPLRIILDTRLEIPLESTVVTTAQTNPTWVMTTNATSQDKHAALEAHGVVVHILPAMHGEVDLHAAFQLIGEAGINSVLLEGGGTLNHGALEAGLVDALMLFIAPKLVGGLTAPTPIEGVGIDQLEDAWLLELEQIEQVGEDVCLHYTVKKR